ncbi:MAG: hypothetical protein ACM3O6_12425 [Acidobacteriota bacterium]
MLANEKTPCIGEHPIGAGPHTFIVSASFDKPFANGFAPSRGLHRKAAARPGSAHVREGRWLLNRDIMRVVAKAHGVVRWTLGGKRHTAGSGHRCPCWYGYVGDKLVAMVGGS